MKHAADFPSDVEGREVVRALWSAVDGAFADAAVFVVDAQQRVVAFSQGAERLLGWKATDVVGEHCRKSNRCQQCMSGCGLRERGVVDDVPLVLWRDDGTTVAVRKTARAFRSEEARSPAAWRCS
jgi:PAS domain S-box-containing protein